MQPRRHATAKLLFAEAQRRGLEPVWQGNDCLFRFGAGEGRRLVYYAKLHINSQLGAAICADKSLTRRVLEAEGFPNIPWCRPANQSEANAFFDGHRPMIQKPVGGMKAENVRLVRKRDEIDTAALPESILEQFIEGTEYRCLVLKGAVAGMQKKSLDPEPDHPWRKRIENLDVSSRDSRITEMSVRIAGLLHMGFIAVDFIVDATGTVRVLELNGMPGLHSFHHPDGGEPVDMAALVLDAILENH